MNTIAIILIVGFALGLAGHISFITTQHLGRKASKCSCKYPLIRFDGREYYCGDCGKYFDDQKNKKQAKTCIPADKRLHL